MAIHHPTPPLGGGERPRLPSAQVGPVTRAIRAIRAGDANANLSSAFARPIRALSRTEVEDLIGDLIDLLNAMDGDTDHEPDVDREPDTDGEPSLCGLMVQWPGGGGDDREEDTADHEAGYQPLHMGGGGYAVSSFGRSA